MKFSSNFAKIKIILSKFRVSHNFEKIIFNFAKLEENFAKHEIKNFTKILHNYENENFSATLLLHNLPSATHPPLPSARRFFNAARQCYFEMKTNKEPCFSILSFIILWFYSTLTHRAGVVGNFFYQFHASFASAVT